MNDFELVRKYVLFRLGTEGMSENMKVVETERRHKCEPSYGFIHMIWIVKFEDGSVVASVPLSTSEKIKSFCMKISTNTILLMTLSFRN